VKITEKVIKINGHKFSTFTRLSCQPQNGMMGIGEKSANCKFHTALRQLSTNNDLHIGITSDNAIMVNGRTGEVFEGSLTEQQHEAMLNIFDSGCRGDCTAGDSLHAFGEENLSLSSLKTLENPADTDCFVVLLSSGSKGKSTITVQLQSSLKKKTVSKIKKSKEKIPTDIHSVRKMCNKKGSLLKHANKVLLAIADFQQGTKTACVSLHHYE
jgi:hypothetical protein